MELRYMGRRGRHRPWRGRRGAMASNRGRWKTDNDFYHGPPRDHMWYPSREMSRMRSLSTSNLRDVPDDWYENELPPHEFYHRRGGGFKHRASFRGGRDNFHRYPGYYYNQQTMPPDHRARISRPRLHSWSPNSGRYSSHSMPPAHPDNYWENDMRCPERSARSASMPRDILPREPRNYPPKEEGYKDSEGDWNMEGRQHLPEKRTPDNWNMNDTRLPPPIEERRLQPPMDDRRPPSHKKTEMEWNEHKRRSQSAPRDTFVPHSGEKMRLRMPDWSVEDRKPLVKPPPIEDAPARYRHEIDPSERKHVIPKHEQFHRNNEDASIHRAQDDFQNRPPPTFEAKELRPIKREKDLEKPRDVQPPKDSSSDGPVDCWTQVYDYMKTLDDVGRKLFTTIWSIPPMKENDSDHSPSPAVTEKDSTEKKGDRIITVFRKLLPPYSENLVVGVEGLKSVNTWLCVYCSVYILTVAKCEAHVKTKEHYDKYREHLRAYAQYKASQIKVKCEADTDQPMSPVQDVNPLLSPLYDDPAEHPEDSQGAFSVHKVDDNDWASSAYNIEDDLDYS